MTKQPKASELRRLGLALAIVPLGGHLGGLLLGFAIIAVVGGLFFGLTTPMGPPVQVYGVVTRLGFAETDFGSRPYVIVRLEDREARVRLPRGGLCRTGDRIVLYALRAPLGVRYRVAPGGCDRPA